MLEHRNHQQAQTRETSPWATTTLLGKVCTSGNIEHAREKRSGGAAHWLCGQVTTQKTGKHWNLGYKSTLTDPINLQIWPHCSLFWSLTSLDTNPSSTTVVTDLQIVNSGSRSCHVWAFWSCCDGSIFLCIFRKWRRERDTVLKREETLF
jgi:hypothetical protein